MFRVLLMDFGGVVAEEGYRLGLYKIADMYNIDRELFFSISAELIYETGYIIGRCDQHTYIEQIRRKTGIDISDSEFERIILSGFKLRKNILTTITEVRKEKVVCAILSDQTDWLDILNKREPFFHYFDYVFNSFYIKMGKRDKETFLYVCKKLGFAPSDILFIDDNPQNVERSKSIGITGHCLTAENEIISLIQKNFPKRG